jgi:tight adherence protein C
VEELADLADVIALAGDDGAAVADTLAAKAAALRTRQLAESSTAANAASEKLTLPGVVLAFGFLVLVCYPALARVLGHA